MPNLFRATMGGGSDIEPYIVIVTLNEDFALRTVTLEQDGQDTLRATCPSSEPYTVTFKPLHDGVWIAKSTTIDGKESAASTEPLLEWGTYYVELKSSFNFEEWLTQGRVTETFESLDDVLADEKTIRQLMTVHDSVDFLANNVTDEDAAKIFDNDLCAKWINLRDYALDTLYANDTCKTAMDNADKYFYGEWALVGQVPNMTSNTAPYGEISADSFLTSWEAYRAFNNTLSKNDSNGGWSSKRYTTAQECLNGAYLQYKFINPICIKSVKFSNQWVTAGNTAWSDTTVNVLASNDGLTWDNIGDSLELPAHNSAIYGINENNNTYIYYRITCNKYNVYAESKYSLAIQEVQFYAWAPKGNVPIMTSNTAPYGEAFNNTEYPNNYQAYKCFKGSNTDMDDTSSGLPAGNGYVGYKFANPIKVNAVMLRPSLLGGTIRCKDFEVRASNDGNTWSEPLYSGTYPNDSTLPKKYYYFANDNYYLYYKVIIKNNYGQSDYLSGLATLQFYGRELSVSVPTMTSNTEPYGEVSRINDSNSGVRVYNASSDSYNYSDSYTLFNGKEDSTKTWSWVAPLGTGWYQYKFPKKVLIKKASFIQTAVTLDIYVSKVEIKASNSGDENDFTSLGVFEFDRPTVLGHREVCEFNNNTEYLYYRFIYLDDSQRWSTTKSVSICGLNFYGLDYSERDFDTEKPSKYIYDHGLNIVDNNYDGVRDNTNKTAVPCYNTPNSIYIPSLKVTNGTTGVFPEDKIDLTDYSLYVGKMSLKPTIQTVDVSNINISCFPYVFGWWDNASSYGTSLMVTSDINKSTKMIAGTIGSNIITHSGVGMADAPYEYYELYLEQ